MGPRDPRRVQPGALSSSGAAQVDTSNTRLRVVLRWVRAFGFVLEREGVCVWVVCGRREPAYPYLSMHARRPPSHAWTHQNFAHAVCITMLRHIPARTVSGLPGLRSQYGLLHCADHGQLTPSSARVFCYALPQVHSGAHRGLPERCGAAGSGGTRAPEPETEQGVCVTVCVCDCVCV